jgi:HAD superfamily hydrolase (TIGR01549 family)
MPKVKAVSLDLWNTLLWDTPDMEARRTTRRFEGILATLAAAGRPVERSALELAYSTCGQTMQRLQSQHLDLPIERQVATLLECLDPALPRTLAPAAFDEVVSRYADIIAEIPPRLVEGAETVIPALKGRGYRLALISNTGRSPGRSLRRVLAGAGLLEHFDVLTFSDEVEASKPGRSIFERTLRDLGGPPPAAVAHVGDDPVLDVLGAKSAGLRAVHFVPDRSGEWRAWAPPPDRDAAAGADVPSPDATLTRLADLLRVLETL